MLKKDWNYRRGDIYLVDLGEHRGNIQGGVRPVINIQNNREYCKPGFHLNWGYNTLFFIIFPSKYFSGIWMKTCFDFQFDCGWIFALKTAKNDDR